MTQQPLHPSVAKTLDALSPQQRKCYELAGHGYTIKEIAHELDLAVGTVGNHFRFINLKAQLNGVRWGKSFVPKPVRRGADK